MLPTTHPRQLRIGFESDAGGREIESEDHLHHHDWKVVLRASWSISAPTVGKTVDVLYHKVGHYIENIVDRCLDRKGTVGPDFVSANIKAYFGSGTGEERYRALCEMRGSFPNALELDCMKLMKYTRRTAALETQHLAFMTIVDLGTLFPGLREIFLRSKCIRDARSSLVHVSGLEDRTEATEWGFWQALAATYLSDTTIAHILEKRNAEEWGDWEKQSAGTCTLHHLLNQYNVRASESTKALCVRYVGSVLELPSFWAKKKGLNERTPGQIATRLCSMLMHVLEDLDIREVEPQSLSLNLDWPFDTDGADRFAKIFLTGISDWFSENDDENRAQPWFNKLEKVVGFLRGPRSAKFLPISSTLARSAAFQNRLPASWKIVDFDEASSSLNLDVKGNTAANMPFANPLHREGANRHIQAGHNSAGENEIEMQSPSSESVEHQTLNAQPSTLSSVSSSDSESAATSESQSQTLFSRRNSLEQNTETGDDVESGAGAFEHLSSQDNDAHTTAPETQPQGTENYPGYPSPPYPAAPFIPHQTLQPDIRGTNSPPAVRQLSADLTLESAPVPPSPAAAYRPPRDGHDRPFAHTTPWSEEAPSPLLMDHPLAVFGDGQPQPLPQTPGSGSVEHQTRDAQRSTLSSASSSYIESESQLRTNITKHGGDPESRAGELDDPLSLQGNDAHTTVPETQPQGSGNHPIHPSAPHSPFISLPTGARNPRYPWWVPQPQGAGAYPVDSSAPYTADQDTPLIPYQTPLPIPSYSPATDPPQEAMPLPDDPSEDDPSEDDLSEDDPSEDGSPRPRFAVGPLPPWAAEYFDTHTPWAAQGRPFTPGTPWSQGVPSPYIPVGHPHPMAPFGGGQPQPPPQTPGSESVELQTPDAQPSTLSSASNSDTGSESQSQTTPAVTPFIPPLNTPSPHPTPQLPLVPQPPTGANPQYPSWATQPQGAGSYPIYPSTPQPGMPQFFPGSGPPLAAMQLPPDPGWGGYPTFGAAPVPPWAVAAYGTPWRGHGGGPPPFMTPGPGIPSNSRAHQSTEAAGASEAIKQLFDAASSLGLDPGALNDLLARSGSESTSSGLPTGQWDGPGGPSVLMAPWYERAPSPLLVDHPLAAFGDEQPGPQTSGATDAAPDP